MILKIVATHLYKFLPRRLGVSAVKIFFGSLRLRVSAVTICLRSPRLCVSAVIIVFAASTFAQRGGQGWVWQNPLPQGNPLNAIHFAKDKLSGFAVGADNTVLRTQDGGFTWQRQALPLDLTLSSVYVKDKKNAVIVGARGGIFRTDNGGNEWKMIKTDTKDHLYSVSFVGETGWATGTYGRILKTIDGGLTWSSHFAVTDVLVS